MTTLVALLIAAAAQAPPSAAAVEATHKQFLDLETKLMGAVQLRTTETLEQLVSPRFGFSLMVEGREPQVMNRSEWLRMTNVHSRLEGFEIRSVAAGAYEDHAMVRAQVVRKGTVGSRDLSGEYVFVDQWAREDGAWMVRYRVVARPVANHGQGGDSVPVNQALYVPTQASGKIGFGQDFNNLDGKDDLIDCGNNPVLDVPGKQITLEAWVQHSLSSTTSPYGILNHKGWNNGYSMWMQGDQYQCPSGPWCVTFNLPGATDFLKTQTKLTGSTWHHVS